MLGGARFALVPLVVFLILYSFERRIVFDKFIMSVLTEKLDSDTYLEIVRQGKFDPPASSYQLYGEYFCGNYQNAVSICKRKLGEPKLHKRFTYQYLVYLANVYFDIGDLENLRVVCEQFETALKSEEPQNQEKYRKLFKRITFYESYLKQDIDACMSMINDSTPKIYKYKNIFSKAKLALMKGNTDEARGYFETLSKEVPQLNYGKIAAEELKRMDSQDAYTSPILFEISDDITEVLLYNAKNYDKRKKLYNGIIITALILVIIGTVLIFIGEKMGNSYLNEIRTLVEEDYDSVTVIEEFTLKDGDEVVDNMFICTTDADVIVGCTYVYRGEEELYYAMLSTAPISSFTQGSATYLPCNFYAITSYNLVYSAFCVDEADIPEDYLHLSSFKVKGQQVYYVVTNVIPTQ